MATKVYQKPVLVKWLKEYYGKRASSFAFIQDEAPIQVQQLREVTQEYRGITEREDIVSPAGLHFC